MEATGLRIGNLILLGDKVIIVSLDVLNRIGKRYYDTYPIPLNEEWSNKCGVELRSVMYTTELIRFIDCFAVPSWINSVHELQNWYYYRFDKKELKVK